MSRARLAIVSSAALGGAALEAASSLKSWTFVHNTAYVQPSNIYLRGAMVLVAAAMVLTLAVALVRRTPGPLIALGATCAAGLGVAIYGYTDVRAYNTTPPTSALGHDAYGYLGLVGAAVAFVVVALRFFRGSSRSLVSWLRPSSRRWWRSSSASRRGSFRRGTLSRRWPSFSGSLAP